MDVAYDGTAYHGWQIQNNAFTVQQELQEALGTILQQTTECTGSGRTDTGVHARQQIVHLDVPDKTDLDKLRYQLNSYLSKSVAIKSIRPVTPEAHARFDAIQRGYRYHIHQEKNPFLVGKSYYLPLSLDLEAIRHGTEIIKEQTNFQAFSKVHTQVNHFDCEIFDCKWEETNEGYLYSVSANRFLRGMVRAMVGTLLEMGTGRLDQQGLRDIMASGDRSKAGKAVPPEGLYLHEVRYPENIYITT